MEMQNKHFSAFLLYSLLHISHVVEHANHSYFQLHHAQDSQLKTTRELTFENDMVD